MTARGWQPGQAQRADDERERQVQAEVERARLGAKRKLGLVPEMPAADPDERCDDCGYLIRAKGHRIACLAAEGGEAK